MDINRKQFLGQLAGGSVVLLLEGCGGGGDIASPTPTPQPAQCLATGSSISSNHGHQAVFPRSQLDSSTDLTFDIRGSADHTHTVTITVAQLQVMKTTSTGSFTSTTTTAHNHVVSFICQTV